MSEFGVATAIPLSLFISEKDIDVSCPIVGNIIDPDPNAGLL